MVLKDVPKTVFVIGGDGSLRSYHESLAKELKVSENVLFTRHIPQEELPRFYAACDIFVIPSVVEAFGLVTIEAMACGKPVIAGRSGGVEEAVVDGKTGILVEPENVSDIREAVLRLLRDEVYAQKLGSDGFTRVRQQFNWKSRSEELKKYM